MSSWTIRGAWLTVTLIGLLWLAPMTRLRQWEVFAILVAPDKVIALSVGVAALLALGCGIFGRRRRVLIPVAIAGLLVSSLYGGRVLVQGVIDPPPPTQGGLTVLSWNAQDTSPADIVSAIASVVRDRDVEVIILPETGSLAGRRVSDGLREVAVAHGAGAASTWPTWLPPWLGISIDRALVGPPLHPGKATVEILRSVDTAGADHWPILVTLSGR